MRGDGRVFKRGNKFWVSYYAPKNGKSVEHREPGGKTEADALRFWGFDGNNEGRHLSYGEYLNSRGKYEESQVINSHMQSLEIYRRMLEEFEPVKHKRPLGKEVIQRILAARIHPSMRDQR